MADGSPPAFPADGSQRPSATRFFAGHPDRFDPNATAVLLALVAGSYTYGDLVAATGLARATVAKHLLRLSGAGLVAWDQGKQGTLRPLVRVIPKARRPLAS